MSEIINWFWLFLKGFLVVFVVWGVWFLACHVRDKTVADIAEIADRGYKEWKEEEEAAARKAHTTWAGGDTTLVSSGIPVVGLGRTEVSLTTGPLDQAKYTCGADVAEAPKKKKNDQKELITEIKHWKGDLGEQAKSLFGLGADMIFPEGITKCGAPFVVNGSTLVAALGIPERGADVVEAPKKKKRKHKTRYLPANRKRHRKSLGWSQRGIAMVVNCSQKTISELEKNDVDSKFAARYDSVLYHERHLRKAGK